MFIRDIALESGYSSGVLAHYFKNKDDLLAHALRLSHTRFRKRDDVEVEETPSAVDALCRIAIALGDLAADFKMIDEIDLNPVIAGLNGVVVADVLVIVGEVADKKGLTS